MTLRLLLALILSATALAGYGQTYDREIYISSSEGCDTNPGTFDAPLKSIYGLPHNFHRRSKILLKRGDVFFDCFHQFHDSYIGAYGEGDRPVVSGFRVLIKPNNWEKVSGKENIWKINLDNDSIFKGIDKSFELKQGQLYNIGCIYAPLSDSIFGHIVSSPDSLRNDGDIFTSSYYKSSDIATHPFGEVQMKLSYSPSCLGTLCFSTFRQCAATIHNCHVCDLAFVGYSSHGASSLTGSTFTNCTFDIIGGAILPDGSKWTRIGNAVEIWANTPGNILIEGCVFSRTFAAAIAIFSNEPGLVTQRGLRFIGNVMTHCSEGLEIHINTGNPSVIPFSLCEFYHNILYRSGQNGFNSPIRPSAAIYSGRSQTPMIPIRYNLFYGGNYYKGVSRDPLFSTNDVYLYPGQNILVNDNQKFPISAVEEYRKQYPTDNSNFTEVTPGDSMDITMTKKIERIINWQPPKLKLYQLLNETTTGQ